jgi:RHH-type proline utilization regulon transcriptional repressor/proline dehydrogenase/delta 1-pyrroline-5-carboxylate dehydrogenase
MLYGMADAEKAALVQRGHRLRIYMPHGELIPGMAYMVRRLLENTSNDSFLQAGFTKAVEPDELLRSPRETTPDSSSPAEPTMSNSRTSLDIRFENEPPIDFAIEKIGMP